MPIFAANDLRVFCRDTGVPVSFNGVATYADGQPVMGLSDRPMQERLGGQGGGGADLAMPELRIPFNAFNPMPRDKDQLMVDGTAYRVSDTGAEDDGGMIVYGLKRA